MTKQTVKNSDSPRVPQRFVKFASQWYSGMNLLYAITSTGGLYLGNRRPIIDNEPATDGEWLAGLWAGLVVELEALTHVEYMSPEESETVSDFLRFARFWAAQLSAEHETGAPLLDEFTRAYCAALLWASTDDNGNPLDDNYSAADIDAQTLREISADCLRFQMENAQLLEAAAGLGQDLEQSGHDYFLTRCGHGVGFWDRGLDDIGEALTEAAKKCGEVWPIVGDDGKIYC